MEEEGTAKTRIHVGGLGESVTVDDLRKVFSALGKVEGLDIVRTKGRSFAYVDFLPSLPNSLSKLFSTYNGCVWKGGKLRLEKAKEHYLACLRREWEEDAELASEPLDSSDDADKVLETSAKHLKAQNSEKQLLRLFFPRLRKVKSLPFNGTGKHKYSFQRVEAPSLPTHFCDCEEHSGPLHTNTREGKQFHGQVHDQEEKGREVNEEEINIMNLVMNKLFQREKITNVSRSGLTTEGDNIIKSTEDPQFDEDESDDDNLILNVVSSGNKREASAGRRELKTTSAKKTRTNDTLSSEKGPTEYAHKVQRKNALPSKNRKLLFDEGYDKSEVLSVVPGQKENSQHDENDNDSEENEADHETDEDNLIINVVSRANKHMPSSGLMEQEIASSSQKSISSKTQASKDGQFQNAPDVKKKNVPPPNKKKTLIIDKDQNKNVLSDVAGEKGNSQTNLIEPKKLSVTEPTEPGCGSKQSSTSRSWSQKSSWRALVGDRNSSAFSLSNILLPNSDAQPVLNDPKVDGSIDSINEKLETLKNFEGKSGKMEAVDGFTEAQATNPGATMAIDSLYEKLATSKDLEGTSGKMEAVDGLEEAQATNPDAAPHKSGRGSSWLHKSSWTQLVSENNSTFSISDILPGSTSAKQTLPKDHEEVVNLNDSNYTDETKLSKSEPNDSFAQVMEENIDPAPKKVSGGDNSIGEACAFMRSAASLKEWAKTKAVIRKSTKRKRNE